MADKHFVRATAFVGVLLSAGAGLAQQVPWRDDVGAGLNSRAQAPAAARRPVPKPLGAVLFDNGPIVTNPGAGAGGADASAVQTSLGLNSYAFGNQLGVSSRVADDFTVPPGQTWNVGSVVFYEYQTAVTPPDPTIDSVNVQIWNGPPNNPSSVVVFGDETTNRLESSTWANIYRVPETNLSDTQRPVYANRVALGVTLTAGTYWIDWQAGGSAIYSGPWVPPVTIVGQTTTGNALVQANAGPWTPVTDSGTLTPQGLPFQLLGPDLQPEFLSVDAARNGVFEPGEMVTIAPTWLNSGATNYGNVTATFTDFTGPAGGNYSISDGAASYGDIPAGAEATCTTDCFILKVTVSFRPSRHWDTTVLETLSASGTEVASKTWTVHLGRSFTDVPATSAYYPFVERLMHNGVSTGCGDGIYCPAGATTRAQMAVFVLLSKEGAGYKPAACAPPNLFSDVPASSPYCRYIEELSNRGVVGGCGGGNYCPTGPVSREEMAVFVLKTLDPALNPPACGTPMFADVPAGSTFCPWIEELARRGVVTGCGDGIYCPTDPVTRDQMAVFLSATFALELYGI